MSGKYCIRDAFVINEGITFRSSVLIDGEYISDITPDAPPDDFLNKNGYEVVDAAGLYLIPGVIDDQVHFRDPGLTYKGDIGSESRAAVAGGVTSFMDMPNTDPKTITINLLEDKYIRAAEVSPANFSFYLGATNDNINELKQFDPLNNCGIKVFMGASTGNMLVDNNDSLEAIFSLPYLIATHCEDETIIGPLAEKYSRLPEAQVTAADHPVIRNADACYSSSFKAVGLAKKHNTRLHVLHLSTAREMELFSNKVPLNEKRITAEVCVHHLWFNDSDYGRLGMKIRWNPAIKTETDRLALIEALNDDRLDIVATDHAPHTLEEKNRPYFTCPSGGPMIQHSLPAMLELHKLGVISAERLVEKMCHAPAECFRVKQRGYIRKGYFADLVLVNMNKSWTVGEGNILYKCGWSPMEGQKFSTMVHSTWVNGSLVYSAGELTGLIAGRRLEFY